MLDAVIKIFGVLVLITILGSLWGVTSYINENGGVKQTIINLGKDVKEIGQEIGKD